MAETLRDQLVANMERIQGGETAPDAPAVVETPAEAPAEASTEAVDKPGRTAGRDRDEKGRLQPGPAKRDTGQVAAVAKPAPAAAAAKPRPAYPSTWKRDYQEHWEKADPTWAEYLLQREQEYTKGVSTYKSKWDQAQPIYEAVAPHLAVFEKHGINPGKQMAEYAKAHHALAFGDMNTKLGVIAQIARDFNIPLQNLFQQGQDGQLQIQQQFNQPPQPQGITPEQVREMVASQLESERTNSQVDSFLKAVGPDGKPTYPHVSQVWETMAGLLQAKIAKDLPDAYRRALLQPEYAHILEQENAAQRLAAEEKAKTERAAQTERARRANVSVRTQTPSVTSGAEKPKGLRDSIAQQVYAKAGGGRV